MIRYINTKTSQGIETLEEINLNEFNNYSEFRKAVKTLVNDYTKAFHGKQVYSSSRSTNDYKNR